MDAAPSSSKRKPCPAMDNGYYYKPGKGAIDPAREESLHRVEAIDVNPSQHPELSSQDLLPLPLPLPPKDESLSFAAVARTTSIAGSIVTSSSHPSLMRLPIELLDHILSYLSPVDLTNVSRCHRSLNDYASADLLWQRHIQANVPGLQVRSAWPCKSFKELYAAHDPCWFLPKYKIWFCDWAYTGKLILVRFDARRGCIEGYQMCAERPQPTFDPWESNPEILIHNFCPRVCLHLDQPVLQLSVTAIGGGYAMGLRRLLQHPDITGRAMNGRASGVSSYFMLAKPDDHIEAPSKPWPPQLIPSRHVVRCDPGDYLREKDRPRKRSEISNTTFRIRTWVDMMGAPNGFNPANGTNPVRAGVRAGSEMYTYSTLDPKLYTPTEEKPYRGIWVGDYSGHGCEFLLMHQPDDETPFDESECVQRADETEEEFARRKLEDRIYRGPIHAIKLTGDINVPKGEITFATDDISNKSLIGRCSSRRFEGARKVASRGHVAGRGFVSDKYIKSQLIMISHDRLAQYWVDFGHISFYERVDIDAFLDPDNDPYPRPRVIRT